MSSLRRAVLWQEVQSAAANDLRPRGPRANPHAPLAVDVVRLPLLADLPPATVAAIRDRMQVRSAVRCAWLTGRRPLPS
jgi:hypothetical protein